MSPRTPPPAYNISLVYFCTCVTDANCIDTALYILVNTCYTTTFLLLCAQLWIDAFLWYSGTSRRQGVQLSRSESDAGKQPAAHVQETELKKPWSVEEKRDLGDVWPPRSGVEEK